MRTPRLAVLLAALTAGCFTCASPNDAPLITPLPESSSPVAAALPPPGPDASPEPDPSYEAFAKRLRDECEPKGPAMSDGEMVAAGHATSFCLHGWIDRELEAIDPSLRAGVVVGTPDPLTPRVRSPAWQRLANATCHIDDAHEWQDGSMRVAGTMRSISGADCWTGPLLEEAYLVHTLRDADASAFAARVRATRAAGSARAEALPSALASAERMHARAPEGSLFDEECDHCFLSDADWRRVVLRLHALDDEPRRLGAALCATWAPLAEQLGGEAPCRNAVRLHLLSYLLFVPSAFEREDQASEYARRSPAKDPDYRQFIEPIIDRCRPGENLHYSSEPYESDYVGCLRREAREREPAAAGARLGEVFRGYVTTLCAVEALTEKTDVSMAFDSDLIYRMWPHRVAAFQCPGLAFARGAFLFDAMRGRDAAAFARHVRWRVPWAENVRRGMAVLHRTSTLPECADYAEQWSRECRPKGVPRADWSRLLAGVTQIEKKAPALGRDVCGAWPDLSEALRGAGACEGSLADYFVSYATYLGLAAIRD